MPRLLTLALLAATLAAVLPSTASAVTAPRTAARPYFDLRSSTDATTPAPSGAASARSELRRDLGRGAELDVDRSTGTTRRIAREGGAVTGPASGDRRAIAEHYIRQRADVIGLSAQDLGTLELDRRVVSPGGVLYLRWRQSVRGIPLFEGGLRASVDADGRIVSIGGAPVRGLVSADTRPGLDSAEALRRAREDALASAGGDDEDDDGKLVLYDTGRGVRLAWAATVYASSQAVYHTLVDAHSGAILHRENLVKFAAPALTWDRYPGATPGGAQRNVDLEAMGWLPPTAGDLSGPFAHAFSDFDDNGAMSSGEEVPRAIGFWIQFQDFTPSNAAGGCDAAHQCSWNFDVPNSWRNNRSQSTVQSFAYVSAFHDHLAAAPIGFDGASGNFEGVDRVNVQTDDGASTGAGGTGPDGIHRNNANMLTPPDVQPPTMQMYLFVNSNLRPFRDINGGDDAAIVYHEYTHGLSNRLITFPGTGAGALGSGQAKAMGEGWSDFYAKDFLANQGLQPDTAAPGEVDMGEYTDSVAHTIRRQALDCPVGAAPTACPGTPGAGGGGFAYDDYGNIGPGVEEHDDGEIWGETLWDMRTALGSNVTEALVTGGMRGSPTLPTFLDERDAIMDADVALFGGHHMAALWRVFSQRGMGSNATTTGNGDPDPVEGFARPADQAPAGPLAATPANVLTGGPVHFNAGGIQDVDGLIGEYRWDFDGNGTVDRTTSTAATDFAYSLPGSFPAAVTAVDDGGNTVRATSTIAVSAPPPPAPAFIARIFALIRITVDRRGRFGARVSFSPAAPGGKARLLVFRKNRRIGSGTVRVKKGDSVRVRIKLTKAGLRALKKSRKFKVSLRLQLPGSTKIVARRTVELRAPKRR
jgi:extracellular elastinolytic metalloproteinase